MGQDNYPFDLRKDRELRLPAPLTIVASAEYIDALESSEKAGMLDGVTLVRLAPDQAVPRELLDAAGIIVCQVDPADPISMLRVEKIRAYRPDLKQIVALSDANFAVVRALLRQGVADVVALPLEAEEILETALRVLEDARLKTSAEANLCPLIAVVRSVGGSGATTVATYLARELGSEWGSGRGACVIDLDIQYGSVTSALGISPRRTLSDLLDAKDRLDGSFLRSVAVRHEDALSVIGAPPDILPLESIDSDQLLRIIEVARQEYDFVVLDLPSNWTSWNLSAVAAADTVLMVVELSIASLQQAKRRLNLFAQVGINRDAVSIVVNRVEKKLFRSIGLDDVQKTLGKEVIAGLHAEGPGIAAARDQGLFLDQVQRKSKFSSDMADLAELLAERLAGGKS